MPGHDSCCLGVDEAGSIKEVLYTLNVLYTSFHWRRYDPVSNFLILCRLSCWAVLPGSLPAADVSCFPAEVRLQFSCGIP